MAYGTQIETAIAKQEKVIKDLRSKIAQGFSTMTNVELGTCKAGIELAQDRIKNLKNGSLSPAAINN